MSTFRTPARAASPLAIAAIVIAAVAAPLGAATATAEPALARSAGDAALQWGPCPPLFPAGCQIAVLHGDPARPNADVFLRVPGGYQLPAHSHTSAERMVLVAGALEVTYDGQEPAMLKPGMYAYGPAKAVHHGRCASEDPCVLFIAFEGPVDAVAAPPPAR